MPPGRCSISKKLILVIYKKDFISRQCYFNARTFTDAIFFHLFGNNDRRTKQGVSIQFSSVSVDLLSPWCTQVGQSSSPPVTKFDWSDTEFGCCVLITCDSSGPGTAGGAYLISGGCGGRWLLGTPPPFHRRGAYSWFWYNIINEQNVIKRRTWIYLSKT